MDTDLSCVLKILEHDVRLRLSAMTRAAFNQYGKRPFTERFSQWPEFGWVWNVEEIPYLRRYDIGIGHSTPRSEPALHYVYRDRVLYFPYSHEEDIRSSELFTGADQCYFPSPELVLELWKRLPNYELPFPEVGGMHVVRDNGNGRNVELARKLGFYVEYGVFAQTNEIVSAGRVQSQGFVTEFAFPGEEPQVVNRLEVSRDLIQRVKDSMGEQVAGDGDGKVMDINGVRLLKDMCYQIQKEHGPMKAKYAWEVYKEAAKLLSLQNSEAS